MKIGFMIYDNINAVSGGNLYDRKLLHVLQAHGAQVELINLRRLSYAGNLVDNGRWGLPGQVAQADFDILLQDELLHPSLFLLNKEIRSRCGAIISIVHHLRSSESWVPWKKRLFRWVERRYLETVDGFIFNSLATKNSVMNLMPRTASGIVMYPGRDHIQPHITQEEIRERTQQSPPLRILFLGNIIPRKGLHYLIEALSELPGDLWKLAVVGNEAVDKVYAISIRSQLKLAGLEQNVVFHGTTNAAELEFIARASHLMAIPSAYEGFGIAYLEGMGYGLPAIASRAGGAGEFITQGQNGFLVDSADVNTLASIISGIGSDRTLLQKLSQNAQETYETHPSWAEGGEQVYQFLSTFMNNASQGQEINKQFVREGTSAN